MFLNLDDLRGKDNKDNLPRDGCRARTGSPSQQNNSSNRRHTDKEVRKTEEDEDKTQLVP